MRKGDTLSAVLELLDSVKATYRVGGTKHAKIYWSLKGREFICVVPRTPSEYRGHKNALARVRRDIREAEHAV